MVIRKTYTINSSISKVWDTLVNPKEIDGWGAGPAKMDGKVGTVFSLWGGDIHGKNIEVDAPKKLVQEWISGDWGKPSIVAFELSESDGKTEVKLTHEKYPEEEHNDLSGGWDDFYFDPIKEYLEKS